MSFENYALLCDAINILKEDDLSTSYTKESEEILAVLEDGDSPITRKYQQKLYTSVMNKSHVDFGDIPKSAGNIRNYSGYPSMIETLETIKLLAEAQNAKEALAYIEIVQNAVNDIADLSATYEKAFQTKTDQVALEYNSYVYFCVEATTALLYGFVETMKDPTTRTLQIKIKNTKSRGDDFFFNQLDKFHKVQNKMGIEYRKYLENQCNKSRDNFIGTTAAFTALGVAAVTAVALSVVPITREIIYQIYHMRSNLSEHLAAQANFLELNKTCVENNTQFSSDKKTKIISRQENLAKKFRALSDKLRVKQQKSVLDSKRELSNDNKTFSMSNIRDEIENSPFELLG